MVVLLRLIEVGGDDVILRSPPPDGEARNSTPYYRVVSIMLYDMTLLIL